MRSWGRCRRSVPSAEEGPYQRPPSKRRRKSQAKPLAPPPLDWRKVDEDILNFLTQRSDQAEDVHPESDYERSRSPTEDFDFIGEGVRIEDLIDQQNEKVRRAARMVHC